MDLAIYRRLREVLNWILDDPVASVHEKYLRMQLATAVAEKVELRQAAKALLNRVYHPNLQMSKEYYALADVVRRTGNSSVGLQEKP
jgi:hypothetical protein